MRIVARPSQHPTESLIAAMERGEPLGLDLIDGVTVATLVEFARSLIRKDIPGAEGSVEDRRLVAAAVPLVKDTALEEAKEAIRALGLDPEEFVVEDMRMGRRGYARKAPACPNLMSTNAAAQPQLPSLK